MKVEIEVPDYTPETGLQMEWDDYYEIVTKIKDGTTVIGANTAGLISLARLCLTLADARVPVGHEWYLDPPNTLEPGSTDLILVKVG